VKISTRWPLSSAVVAAKLGLLLQVECSEPTVVHESPAFQMMSMSQAR